MTIQWILSGLVAALLAFPADRLLSSRVELRSFECFQTLENSPRFRPWWWVPVLWLDPLRGFVAVWIFRHDLAFGSAERTPISFAHYGTLVAFVVIAIMVQTFTRRGDHHSLLAPIGFVAGVAAALVPWPVAAIGVTAALIGLFAFRQFSAYFVCGPIAVVVIGYVLDARMMFVFLAACGFVMPIATEFITGKHLEIPTRNSSGGRLRTPAS